MTSVVRPTLERLRYCQSWHLSRLSCILAHMRRFLGFALWALVSIGAAAGMGAIALNRGEAVNSLWLVIAAACTYLLGYRFYARFLASRVLPLDNNRATPAERLRDGHDYEPTNKWIV